MTDLSENLLNAEKEGLGGRIFGFVMNLFILLVIVIFAVASFFEPVLISGNSMQNTIYDGETVLISNAYSQLERGDIVVIDAGDNNIIKRVVAVGGDKIGFVRRETENGDVIDLYLDKGEGFVLQNEPYKKEDMIYFGAIFKKMEVADSLTDLVEKVQYQTVEKGNIVALGDNRNVSKDSRFYGHFKLTQVLGKKVKVFSEGDDSMLKRIIDFIYSDVRSANNN